MTGKPLFLLVLGVALGWSFPAVGAAEAPKDKHAGMFDVYEENRAEGIGNYITVDFVLTAYHLFVRDTVTAVEEQILCPAFKDLVERTLAKLAGLKDDTPGHGPALAYLWVLRSLLESGGEAPAPVASQVASELELIRRHQGIDRSFVTGTRQDYSQYVPRGKYAQSEVLRRHFAAMMYAARMGFALKDSKATGVTKEMADLHTAAALLLCRLMAGDEELSALHERINTLLATFAGSADDLVPGEFLEAAGDLPPEKARERILERMKERGRLPRIVSGPVDRTKLEPGVSVQEAAAGFRLLGQRYTPESEAFQNLVFDSVGDYRGKESPFTLAMIQGRRVRGFPTILDVMAALGSGRAAGLLKTGGDTDYEGYGDRFRAASSVLRQTAYNPSSLSGMNLKVAYTLLRPETGESLNAAIGAWIQNRHNMLLYTKQSYTVTAKSLGMHKARRDARIEPAVSLYDALVESTCLMHRSLYPGGEIALKTLRFGDILRNLRALAMKQEEWGLERQDCDYLNKVDRLLGELVTQPDAPVVVDVHTEANSGLVLEEATGYPLVVFDGETKTLRGARYSCYEFKHPMDHRLTDESWRRILDAGEAKGLLTDRIMGKVVDPLQECLQE